MRDTGKVVLTFFGSIIFCTAIVGTVQAILRGDQGGGTAIGGIIIGVGLAMLIIPWLRDDDPYDVGVQERPAERTGRIDAT